MRHRQPTLPGTPIPARHRGRRASTYILVLGVSLIVGVLGLAALANVRIQRRNALDVGAVSDAQRYSRVAINMALFQMQHDPDWRRKMQDGEWENDQVVGDGTYGFRAFDPVDDDLTDSDYDPVVIVGTGKSGPARQNLQVRVNARLTGLRCLEPSIHANQILTFEGADVYSYRFVSANNEVESLDNADVYADAEAAVAVTANGGRFHGSTTTNGEWPRQMPDPLSVFDYYLANGTSIRVEDLPFWDRNHVANPGFEDPSEDPWVPNEDCKLNLDGGTTHSGTRALKVFNRNSPLSGPAQVITEEIQSGETYHTEAMIYIQNKNSEDDFRIYLRIDSTGDGVRDVAMSPWKKCKKTKWTKVEGESTITWTGTLNEATWYVRSDAERHDFLIDDVVFDIEGAPAGWRTLHRTALGPTQNPFGAGSTNAQGIYVIDCQGEKLSIKDSRISGTLVLRNQHLQSLIHGSVHWEPARVGGDPTVPNLPALVTDSEITLAYGQDNLDEPAVNMNFNPPGIPYQGNADDDRQDAYPSLIRGVIYSSKKITVEDAPSIHGVLVSDKDILVRGSELNVTWDPVYFDTNPPPGFRAGVILEIEPGSFEPVVD